jgi:branched-chain amino acid transport system permease protein
MRDNGESAGLVVVDVVSSRVVRFLGTAPFLGAAGAMIALQKLRIAPSASFSISDWTVLVIFNVVIGGIGSIEGPIIGTIVFFVLREYLSDLGAWSLILLGIVSITITLVEPRGIWGMIRRLLPDDVIATGHQPPRGL